MRYAARTDASQAAIVAVLRRAGCLVLDLSRVGGGCPDLLVGAHGRLMLLEVKTEDGEQNEAQRNFAAKWGRCVAVVRTPQEALRMVLGAS